MSFIGFKILSLCVHATPHANWLYCGTRKIQDAFMDIHVHMNGFVLEPLMGGAVHEWVRETEVDTNAYRRAV